MSQHITTAVFVIYMIGILLVGVYASRFVEKTPESFYLGDRGLGTIVLLFTFAATIMSAFTFFGLGGDSRATGLGLAIVFILNPLLWAPLFATIGYKTYRVGKKFSYTTPTEYLRDRFDSETVPIVYIVVSTLGLIGFATTQMIGGGVALNVLLGLPYVYTIIGIALLMAVYIHISGMRGVAWSDTIQGAILFLSLVVGFFAVLAVFGPQTLIEGVQNANAELFTMVGPIGVYQPLFLVSFSVSFAIAFMTYPQLYQRFLAADSTKSLKNAVLLLPVVAVIASLAAIALGVWSVGIVPDIEQTDYTIPYVFEAFAHPVFVGIALSAGVAALMSTTDSVLLSLSSIIGRDVYREYFNPDATDGEEVDATRWVIHAMIVVALVLAYIRPGTIFQLGALAVVMHGPLVPAVYLSKYWDGATAAGSVASMIVGAVVVLGYFFDIIPSQYEFGMYYGAAALIVTIVVFVGVSLVTSEHTSERVEEILSA